MLYGRFSKKNNDPRFPERVGNVPARPSGRFGHNAVVAETLRLNADDELVPTTVMTIYGGQGPNCSDYCGKANSFRVYKT